MFYLSGSEVSLNVMLLKVGFHSRLSAWLRGQPTDHTELLVLQLPGPQSKFNLSLPLSLPLCYALASHCGLLFLKDRAGTCLEGVTAISFLPQLGPVDTTVRRMSRDNSYLLHKCSAAPLANNKDIPRRFVWFQTRAAHI